jgi:hypothetical protein
VNVIVDVAFAGMVTVVDGVIVRFPELSLPLQNTLPRVALCNVKVLPVPLGGPPVEEFQVTLTVETVIE